MVELKWDSLVVSGQPPIHEKSAIKSLYWCWFQEEGWVGESMEEGADENLTEILSPKLKDDDSYKVKGLMYVDADHQDSVKG